jgi:hypothetical protein
VYQHLPEVSNLRCLGGGTVIAAATIGTGGSLLYSADGGLQWLVDAPIVVDGAGRLGVGHKCPDPAVLLSDDHGVRDRNSGRSLESDFAIKFDVQLQASDLERHLCGEGFRS